MIPPLGDDLTMEAACTLCAKHFSMGVPAVTPVTVLLVAGLLFVGWWARICYHERSSRPAPSSRRRSSSVSSETKRPDDDAGVSMPTGEGEHRASRVSQRVNVPSHATT